MNLTLDSPLGDVRRFIDSITESLDPQSRYITDLRALVAASSGTRELIGRLAASSRSGGGSASI